MQHKSRPDGAFALDGVHVEFSVAVVEEATAGAVDEAAGARGGVGEEEELGAVGKGSGMDGEAGGEVEEGAVGSMAVCGEVRSRGVRCTSL